MKLDGFKKICMVRPYLLTDETIVDMQNITLAAIEDAERFKKGADGTWHIRLDGDTEWRPIGWHRIHPATRAVLEVTGGGE